MQGERERLPIPIVAEKLNTTPLNVLMHIKRGLLRGVEAEGVWLIEAHSLDELLAKTGGNKAVDLCASGCAKKQACNGGCS